MKNKNKNIDGKKQKKSHVNFYIDEKLFEMFRMEQARQRRTGSGQLEVILEEWFLSRGLKKTPTEDSLVYDFGSESKYTSVQSQEGRRGEKV